MCITQKISWVYAAAFGKEKSKHAILGIREQNSSTKMANTKQTLNLIIHNNMRVGYNTYTNNNPSYTGAYRRHKVVKHSTKEYVNGMAHTNGIESVWAVLKRGYNRTYHNWSMKHCKRYVDEFVFRLSEGNCKVDTVDRLAAMVDASGGKSIKYKELLD
ncbi:MAG: transposase [Chromatiales bacterium]|nr:transposase [Chromatiales bacterium]